MNPIVYPFPHWSTVEQQFRQALLHFESNKYDLTCKRGFYVYGHPGCGKTTFVKQVLRSMNYDMVSYDAGDIRNKSVMDAITNHHMGDKNVMSMFYGKGKSKSIAIVMDEIDGMNNGDKGGINSLIKIIRPKKTKKQQTEDTTANPIVCIGNYHMDKKIKELIKVCYVIELPSPSDADMMQLLQTLLPTVEPRVQSTLVSFIQGDLRRLASVIQMQSNAISQQLMHHVLLTKSPHEDSRVIARQLLQSPVSIDRHLSLMNETDRTIVGLLWHENVVDVVNGYDTDKLIRAIPLYTRWLHNMCIADSIDRVTFQHQIWQFNEMSSLIKTMLNHRLYHQERQQPQPQKDKDKKRPANDVPSDLRFTKVLTKYSTEYNNSLFIQHLCMELSMDKSDLFVFFLDLKQRYNNPVDNPVDNPVNHIVDNPVDNIMASQLFANVDVSKLDVLRLYRYLDKYTLPYHSNTSQTKACIDDLDVNIDVNTEDNVDANVDANVDW